MFTQKRASLAFFGIFFFVFFPSDFHIQSSVHENNVDDVNDLINLMTYTGCKNGDAIRVEYCPKIIFITLLKLVPGGYFIKK